MLQFRDNALGVTSEGAFQTGKKKLPVPPDQVWLEAAVDGTTVLLRTRLNSVPYALHSASPHLLDGVTSAGFAPAAHTYPEHLRYARTVLASPIGRKSLSAVN